MKYFFLLNLFIYFIIIKVNNSSKIEYNINIFRKVGTNRPGECICFFSVTNHKVPLVYLI